ncbi:hypothetical protein EDC61_10450 [Sulfuritortus calidifontis]|uniref:Uncharacterized protein n=1 Tax=Sulfuritortus calidifontis TaxID=1914471 RepID=A0A4R3JWK8_9PROT|nr:hypothetical protein [Sulfuritortus calidifontis]TCS72640.1 hypothetical protein EDC61_10450 [Sulfuritortus calidifontis]
MRALLKNIPKLTPLVALVELKGKVTMLFITHQIPRGLQVDEVLSFGPRQQATRMEVVEDERRRDGEDMVRANEGD